MNEEFPLAHLIIKPRPYKRAVDTDIRQTFDSARLQQKNKRNTLTFPVIRMQK